MIKELDTVVLTHDLISHGLKKGDVGAVVHCYSESNVFEVEFVTTEGKTIVLLSLEKADIRPVGGKEVLHVRELSQIAA